MNIMIGVPVHRPLEFRTFESFVKLANLRGKFNYYFAMTQNSLVYDAREFIAQEFLKSNCEYLMMIDSDMTFHPQSIEFLQRHEKPFVTAKAFKRVPPYQPCFYTKVDLVDGQPLLESPVEYGAGLLPIEGAGLACALMHRDVFANIKAPYFFPYPNIGEDLTFCLKLKEAGVQMFCDTTLQFGHIGAQEIMESDFKRMYDQSKAEGKTLMEMGL
jgi:hypothetical protein